MPSPQKKYTTLVSNTLLFAISNFSSKLLSFFIRPYLSYALDSPDVMGVSSLLQQATNLLIPVVSLGVAYAVIRFGLDKATNKSSVFVNGAATIGLGFVVLLLAMPLVRLIPNAAEYLGFLYLCVLASCMRTLCTQFIRSRMLNRLVAIDGVLTTLSLLLYYLLFLSVLKMGATGFLLANALADLTSMVFVFIAGGCWRYFKPKAFDKTLWKEMLRYCLPMIPASISFWIINASDMFFVQGMCEGYAGRSGNHWVGLLSAGYFLPQIITILGSIFYEAWQLSAVTEETDRQAFFSKIFRVYASVLFCRPKQMELPRPSYTVRVENRGEAFDIYVKSNCYAHQVELETDLTDRPFSDNYFPLCTPQGVCVALEKNSVEPEVTVEQLRESLRVRSVADTY